MVPERMLGAGVVSHVAGAPNLGAALCNSKSVKSWYTSFHGWPYQMLLLDMFATSGKRTRVSAVVGPAAPQSQLPR